MWSANRYYLPTGCAGWNLIILKPALCDSITTEKNDAREVNDSWTITECAELEGTTMIIRCYPLDHSPIQTPPLPLPRAWAPLQQLHPQGSDLASEPLNHANSLWVNPNLRRETTQLSLKYATVQQRKQNCHVSKKICSVTNEQLRIWHLEIPVCGTFFHRSAEL